MSGFDQIILTCLLIFSLFYKSGTRFAQNVLSPRPLQALGYNIPAERLRVGLPVLVQIQDTFLRNRHETLLLKLGKAVDVLCHSEEKMRLKASQLAKNNLDLELIYEEDRGSLSSICTRSPSH